MIHITKIKLKEKIRCLPKGLEIIPQSQITLLVGDQGCGKSTLLELLHQHGQNPQRNEIEVHLTEEAKKGVNCFYFDTEKHNPRINHPSNYTNFNGTDKGIGFGASLISRFASHGEILKKFTVDSIASAHNSIVFIDEPESALSLRNQYKLIRSIQKACKQNCQLFIATHCLPLIQHIDMVYSLENKQWMRSVDFIASNQTENELTPSKEV